MCHLSALTLLQSKFRQTTQTSKFWSADSSYFYLVINVSARDTETQSSKVAIQPRFLIYQLKTALTLFPTLFFLIPGRTENLAGSKPWRTRLPRLWSKQIIIRE